MPANISNSKRMLAFAAAFAVIGVVTLIVTKAATTDGIGTDTSCVFLKADQPLQQAFCDSFNLPHNGGTQTGDLSPILWGVSREGAVNIFSSTILNAMTPSHNACAGGGVDANGNTYGPETPPPADVRVCNGQMAESLNDGHGVVNLDTYPKQPFDWSNRTGTVVFDVSLNSDGTHGAWPEFIITDEPVPGARFSVSGGVPNHAVNEVGITFDGCGGACVGRVYLSKNGNYTLASGSADLADDAIDATAVLVNDGQVQEANQTPKAGMALNHVEVRISQNSLEVWASDPGGANFKKIAHVNNLGLASTFTKGLVWLSDTHYNARKSIEPCECGTQYDHTFFWDNLGFDGPKTYRDLGYDVPMANQPGNDGNNDPAISEGYRIGSGESLSFTFNNVVWSQTPTKAKVVLNPGTYDDGASLSISINGHAAVTKPILGWQDYAISYDFPTSDVIQGSNTLKFTANNGLFLIANMSLIMVAGAPVPGSSAPTSPPPPPPSPDTLAPVVSLSAPANNSSFSVGTSVTLSANATDDTGVTKVEFYVDSALKNTDSTSPYSYTLNTTGMTAGSHTIFARAFDAANNSSQSSTVTMSLTTSTTPPPPPSTATVSSNLQPGSTISGNVTWTATTTATSVSKIEFYIDNVLKWSEASAPYQYNGDPGGVLDTTTLSNGSHSLKLIAYYTGGTVADTITVTIQNGPTADTTAPSTPTGLTATANSATQVALRWTASTDNVGVAGYWVTRNGVSIAKTTGTGTTFTDSNVNPGTAYSYTVSAYDAANNTSQASSAANITTPALADTSAPSTPANLSATAVSSSQINLSWSASTDNVGVTGYDVYRLVAAQSTKIATVTSTSFGDSGLTAGTLYSYFVVAHDAAGNSSANSATVSATTQALAVTGSLTGTIKDAAGAVPTKAQATIYFNGARHIYAANSTGTYIATDIPAATYSVKYTAFKLTSQVQTVTIPAGGTAIQNVTMVKR